MLQAAHSRAAAVSSCTSARAHSSSRGTDNLLCNAAYAAYEAALAAKEDACKALCARSGAACEVAGLAVHFIAPNTCYASSSYAQTPHQQAATAAAARGLKATAQAPEHYVCKYLAASTACGTPAVFMYSLSCATPPNCTTITVLASPQQQPPTQAQSPAALSPQSAADMERYEPWIRTPAI
jgi:hypothetical protein